MKIVINNKHGGFGLSREAYKFLGLEWDGYGHGDDIKRDDPKLIECVEKLGEMANGEHAHLDIVEIPDDVNWQIGEYDGREWVEEVHRKWG